MPERDLHEPVPGQMALVPQPPTSVLLWPDAMPEAGMAKWARYKLKTRQPCTTCILVLQQHDRSPFERRPPAPFASTWIRTVGGGPGRRQTWHCSLHGADLKQRDEREDRRREMEFKARNPYS